MARAACPFTGRETRAKSAKRVGAERHFSASRLKTDEETLTRVSPAPLLRKCEPREPRNITRFLKVAHCECTYQYTYIYLFCLCPPLPAPLLHRSRGADSEVAVRSPQFDRATPFMCHVIVEITLNAQLKKRHDGVSENTNKFCFFYR